MQRGDERKVVQVQLESAADNGAAQQQGLQHRHVATSDSRVDRRDLQRVRTPILVVAASLIGTAILAEASLSFLGLGVQPPEPTWGNLLAGQNRDLFEVAPWLAIFPGLAITVTVLAFNLLGDALRDVLDPRNRGRGA